MARGELLVVGETGGRAPAPAVTANRYANVLGYHKARAVAGFGARLRNQERAACLIDVQ